MASRVRDRLSTATRTRSKTKDTLHYQRGTPSQTPAVVVVLILSGTEAPGENGAKSECPDGCSSPELILTEALTSSQPSIPGCSEMNSILKEFHDHRLRQA